MEMVNTIKVYIKDVTNKLVIDYRAREWCKKPYPDHPNGCPNYNKKPECPPQSPLIEDFIKLELSHWFVIVRFDLQRQEERMQDSHPQWSVKMCRNSRYWQNSVRKVLHESCNDFMKGKPELVYTLLPESYGIHVINTVKHLGIPIKVRPKKYVYKIALIGFSKQRKKQSQISKWL
jgi:predicted metal-binding protein